MYKSRKGGDLGAHLPKNVMIEGAVIPPYPYGPNSLFHQSNKGLYAGQMIQFGNNVSPDTKTKSRRSWKPNILTKALYSVALKKRIKLRLTSKALKTMDREGGLDNYLLKESETRIKELGPLGWALRWRLMQVPEVIAKFRAEAAALGLAQEVIDAQWPTQPKIKIAGVTREEAARRQAAEQARFEAKKARETRIKELKYRAIQDYKNKFLRRRLAVNGKVAEKMALPELEKEKRLLKILGDQKTLAAYMRAENNGQVMRAGGRTAWLAKYRAEHMFKSGELEEKDEHGWLTPREREVVEENKDWSDLAQKTKGDDGAPNRPSFLSLLKKDGGGRASSMDLLKK
jgi:large subunit ribosomal protein L28